MAEQAGLYGSFPVTVHSQISAAALVPIWIWVAIVLPCQPLTLLLASSPRTPRRWN